MERKGFILALGNLIDEIASTIKKYNLKLKLDIRRLQSLYGIGKKFFKVLKFCQSVNEELTTAKGRKISYLFNCSVAEAFKGRVFYYPNSYDSRGRIYPFGHVFQRTSGVYKYILSQEKSERLTPGGVFWLKIFMVVSLGKSFDKREDFISFADYEILKDLNLKGPDLVYSEFLEKDGIKGPTSF